jgi:putative transposase
MVGAERFLRNVKHEDVCLYGYVTKGEWLIGLANYFAFYKTERSHQSLDYQSLEYGHKTSSGGGAMIVDQYRAKE